MAANIKSHLVVVPFISSSIHQKYMMCLKCQEPCRVLAIFVYTKGGSPLSCALTQVGNLLRCAPAQPRETGAGLTKAKQVPEAPAQRPGGWATLLGAQVAGSPGAGNRGGPRAKGSKSSRLGSKRAGTTRGPFSNPKSHRAPADGVCIQNSLCSDALVQGSR